MKINSNNCFGVEPPKDASGKIIPLNTKTLYDLAGEVISVESFQYLAADKKKWIVSGYNESVGNCKVGYTDTFTLFKLDSWDKLIKDLKNAGDDSFSICRYFNQTDKNCNEYQQREANSCESSAFLDIAARIETLRKKNDDLVDGC